MSHILALDQGTTSSRAVLFDQAFTVRATAQAEFPQDFPRPGWVEHDPQQLWDTSLTTARTAMALAGVGPGEVAAIGITNQRETTILWERASGKPLAPAIVWQDRRSQQICEDLRNAGHEPLITARTGLLLDPYFSATKLKWLLDSLPDARARAVRGELAFGTVDSWLIWHLTGGRVHATDATNAARTMLFDIRENRWDTEICAILDIPVQLLPEVRDCAAEFGTTDPAIFGAPIAIRGVAGDQQAAAMGQACFRPGMMKSTYGTGCFALLNTGSQPIISQNRLLTTIASRLNGETHYALEGSIFIAGAVVQWLRDGLKLIRNARDTETLAERADPVQGVTMVPAFTGLGAPYWRPDCRGAIFGLSRGTGPAELARAALESVAFQTHDLMEAMLADWGQRPEGVLRVDGGMAANDWVMQFLADLLNQPVDRPQSVETTALGAAFLAGMQSGLTPGPEAFAQSWTQERRFTPAMAPDRRQSHIDRWSRAISATMAF